MNLNDIVIKRNINIKIQIKLEVKKEKDILYIPFSSLTYYYI